MPEIRTNNIQEQEIQIRVRYNETDRMGFLHHANYLVYFELGRTDLLRTRGIDYKSVEDSGHFLVVAKAKVDFRSPARYDDDLTLLTKIKRITPVRIEHEYRVTRGTDLIATGETTIACVDKEGNLSPIPENVY